MDENVSEVLWEFLRENCLPRQCDVVYGDDDNLFEAGIIDSAGVLAFVAFIEGVYGLSIPDEDLLPENFKSVATATRYIGARRRAGSGAAVSEPPHA
jgi:acyl carrier protein